MASFSPDYGYNAVEIPAATNKSSVAFVQERDIHKVSARETLMWCPPYLQRRCLAAFFVFFVLLIITTEVLLAVSTRQQGLATTDSTLHYIWTLGITALLTLVAALWARVEFQAKLTAPWYRMMAGSPDSATVSRTLLLDYLSVLQPVALLKTIQNKDTAVAAITAISILLRIIIVFSAGLVTLELTNVVHTSMPITLLTAFTNNATAAVAALGAVGTMPYYMVDGLLQLNFTLPDGITNRFAYQSIRSDFPISTEFQATVDGFSADLECEPATISTSSSVTPTPEGAEVDVVFTMATLGSSPTCQVRVGISPPTLGENTTYFARFVSGGCGSSTDIDQQRLGLAYGTWELVESISTLGKSPSHIVTPTILQYTGLLCTPTYNISTLDISKNGTQTLSAAVSSNPSSHQLEGIHAWDIMQAHLSSYSGVNTFLQISRGNAGPWQMSGSVRASIDVYMKMAMQLQNATGEAVLPTSLLDPTFLSSMVRSYWQQFAAIIAQGSLMEATSIPSTATATTIENRLVVRPLAAHLISGLLAASLLLILVSGFTLLTTRPLPSNPTAIIGTASLLVHSHYMMQSLSVLGSADIKILSDVLIYANYYIPHPSSIDQKFMILATNDIPESDDLELVNIKSNSRHPFPLHPITRLLLLLALLGSIAALEATLRVSQKNSGLGEVADETYLHYLWTTLPAIFFSLIALYYSGVDFSTRCLAPYANLGRGKSLYRSSVGLDLLDCIPPLAMIREMRTGSYAAFFSTVSITIASFFTILTASLFYVTDFPIVAPIQLQTVTSFLPTTSVSSLSAEDKVQLSASLILEKNLTYPAFTYETLAFPEFKLASGSLEDYLDHQNDSDSALMINATVPALRSQFACRLYGPAQIRTNQTSKSSDLLVFMTGESCHHIGPDGQQLNIASMIIDLGNATDAFFGNAYTLGGCSDVLWAWGHLSMSSNPNITSISAMGCNETLEVVEVAVTFFGADLLISSAYPPIPDESTSRSSAASLGIASATSLYDDLTQVSSPNNVLDAFFGTLTTSRYAIPVTALGDPSQAQAVADAVKFHHGIIRAQLLNWDYRSAANVTNATLAATAPQNLTRGNDAREYNGTMFNGDSGRRSVVQDAASTRVLEALLAATAVFSSLAWLLMRNTNVLPRSPTSIASVASLLANGNILDFLPEDAEHMGVEELARVFPPGTTFRLGWGQKLDQAGFMVDRYSLSAVVPAPDGGGEYMADSHY